MTSSLQAMRDLLAEDKRYKLDAYQFIRESLQYAHDHMMGELEEDDSGEKTGPRHVTGQQLCEACRLYGMEQYGYLTKMVLAKWGIQSTSDFGELVYNLIRIEQMRRANLIKRTLIMSTIFDAFEPEFELAAEDEN